MRLMLVVKEKYTDPLYAVNLINNEISHLFFLLLVVYFFSQHVNKCKTAPVRGTAASTVFDACLHNVKMCWFFFVGVVGFFFLNPHSQTKFLFIEH